MLEDEFESKPKIRIVIPPMHRYQAMLAIHVQEHWGVQRTMQQVQKVFYWPSWRNDTSIFVTECAGCLHREQINLKDVVPHEDQAKNVNDVLCIDLVGPISLSANKNKYILTMLDQFSRYACAVALPDKSAKTVSTAIMGSWISLYGAPQTIRMDQGSEFNNYLLKSMLEGINVNIKVGYAHNHQSNPVERFHRTLWALLRAKKMNGIMIGIVPFLLCYWHTMPPSIIQHYAVHPEFFLVGNLTSLIFHFYQSLNLKMPPPPPPTL